MMKKGLKALAALLCASLLLGVLAGCGGAGGGNVEYGRYVEEDITPPDMKGEIRTVNLQDGVIDVVTWDWEYDPVEETSSQAMYRYRSEDNGQNWQEISMAWADPYNQSYDENNLPDEIDSLSYGVGVLANGDLIAGVTTYTNEYEAIDFKLLRVALDGTVTDFRVPAIEEHLNSGMSVQVSQIASLPGDKLYINTYVSDMDYMVYTGNENQHAVFDGNTGEQLYTIEWDGWDLLYNDKYIYLQDYVETTALDIATGEPVQLDLPSYEDITSISTMGMSQGSMFFDDDNLLYSMSSRGIQTLDAEGNTQTIMRAENYSFGAPLTAASYFAMPEDEVFLVALSESSGLDYASNTGKLYRYYYDAKAPATSDTVITVYSMYDALTVRLAISEFKKLHPEYSVVYEYPFERDEWGNITPMNDGVENEDDALRVLSTELLAGKGPDILILDDLPMDSYIEQKILEDISDVVTGTDIIETVLEPMKQDGKLYAVPTTISIPLIFGETGTVASVAALNDLVTAIENDSSGTSFAEPDYETGTDEEWEAWNNLYMGTVAPADRPVVGFSSVDEAVDMLYNINAPKIYTPGKGMDADGLRTLLEQTKSISDMYKLNSLPEDAGGFARGGVGDGYIVYTIPQLVQWGSQAKAQYGIGVFNTFRLLQNIRTDTYYARFTYSWDEEGNFERLEDDEYVMPRPEFKLLTGDAGGVYHPGTLAGVCSTSNEKEAALDFIKCLLSDGVQGKDLADGFPVSRSAFTKMFEATNADESWYLELGIKPLTMDVDEILDNLTSPAYTNTMLLASITQHAGRYCKGEVTLDDAVQAILADSELYFAERQ